MLPRLIQGGMGAGVSSWGLARAVASTGQMGVVSGTALDTLLIRRLGAKDPGGHIRRALAAFPVASVAERIIARYFVASDAQSTFDAKAAHAPRFKRVPLPTAVLDREREWLLVAANFVEVFLARESNGGVVGINYLHKIQLATLPSLFGAMLAGVDAVLMGAGIPGEIPGVLDDLSAGHAATAPLDVADAGDETFSVSFDPAALWASEHAGPPPSIRRPAFLAIVASATLARALLKKSPGGIAGFIVEAPTAGGHNAPPRGTVQISSRGEPVYGPRDQVDLEQMRALGVPFWLAGGYAHREKFQAALDAGARGVQVGTAFAFCNESGLDPDLRTRFLESVRLGHADIFTDPAASPTGFPFKVAMLPGTLSDPALYEKRERICDLGYLRKPYRRPDGTLGFRCPGEPVHNYVKKGGHPDDTIGRKCLCNALLANIGLGQRHADGAEELPLLTAGDDVACVGALLTDHRNSYSARDVVESILPVP